MAACRPNTYEREWAGCTTKREERLRAGGITVRPAARHLGFPFAVLAGSDCTGRGLAGGWLTRAGGRTRDGPLRAPRLAAAPHTPPNISDPCDGPGRRRRHPLRHT